ncbi:hypothetical protein DESUT3_26030 [Desulfuromonas versatilis]|uniref:DUF3024 domain-containing protein n=1 Tax=Desulfuromonas versatilis TaxID=2802975 RepID=A0ABN6DZY5_9BACT|nr:DUF3024 domain-containing protein [Desulfuromonas versatilis]BCR05534.1 hypothetical protein DESUT3_26030 [Desulfuromonas versatilis]
MPLPPLVKQLVEKKLSAYCQKKIPNHLHNEIRLSFKFRGNTITLFESRPAFRMPEKWVEISVAQFRYDTEENLWALYCADRNSRWHPDMNIDPVKNFDRLLQEIDQDSTGIYWG